MLQCLGNKRMFIFYGVGGVDKSAVCNIIFNAVAAVANSPPSMSAKFTVRLKDARYLAFPDEDRVCEAASARIMNAADIHIADNQEINLQTTKLLTGMDNI